VTPTGFIQGTPQNGTATISPLDSSLYSQDSDYYDGAVVIATYYTLFENGLFETAYGLFSATQQKSRTLEDYVNSSQGVKIYKTRIVRILPYYEYLQLNGIQSTREPENQMKFYIQVDTAGEGGMAGSVKNGIYDYFISLIKEKDYWKINSINTAPLP